MSFVNINTFEREVVHQQDYSRSLFFHQSDFENILSHHREVFYKTNYNKKSICHQTNFQNMADYMSSVKVTFQVSVHPSK